MVLCVNLLDEAEKKGISVDLTALQDALGEVLQERAASESKALTLMNVINVAGPILLLLLSTAALVGDSYNPFLYFRF